MFDNSNSSLEKAHALDWVFVPKLCFRRSKETSTSHGRSRLRRLVCVERKYQVATILRITHPSGSNSTNERLYLSLSLRDPFQLETGVRCHIPDIRSPCLVSSRISKEHSAPARSNGWERELLEGNEGSFNETIYTVRGRNVHILSVMRERVSRVLKLARLPTFNPSLRFTAIARSGYWCESKSDRFSRLISISSCRCDENRNDRSATEHKYTYNTDIRK